MNFHKIRLSFENDDQIARITLASPKGNILDRTMMAELHTAFESCTAHEVKVILLDADGLNFSFGASIEEHLPNEVRDTLQSLHVLLRTVVRSTSLVIAAVRGYCLGGGFELALACDLIFADNSARFGSPEIKIGVFAPAASALLPVRLGQARAAQLLLSGNNLNAEEARECGLVWRIAPVEDFDSVLNESIAREFCPLPAHALQFACQAARIPIVRALEEDLPILEDMYLNGLMPTPGSTEGIEAFLEKRPPRWTHQALVR